MAHQRRAASCFGDLPGEALEGDRVRFGASAHTRVEGVDRGQLLVCEGEVEDVEVLGDAVGLGSTWGSRSGPVAGASAASLRGAVRLHRCDLADGRVVECAAVPAVAVEGDAADR